ncbi:hypothetical protein niasHS_000613 [Heterodera schachtii]|uniref:Alpha-(1,6)-fucosyltransferase n=1 Tax=Heterodera schachtii TaxID=97005 RepID=A0ABD2K4S4_HETSC
MRSAARVFSAAAPRGTGHLATKSGEVLAAAAMVAGLRPCHPFPFSIFIFIWNGKRDASDEAKAMKHKWCRSLLPVSPPPFAHWHAKWLLVATAFCIWLFLIVLVVVQQPQDNGTICGRGTKLERGKAKNEKEKSDENQIEMEQMGEQLEALRRENERLKEENSNLINPTKDADQSENGQAAELYSKEHELARRELNRLIMELLYTRVGSSSIKEQLEGQRDGQQLLNDEQILHLLAHSRQFAHVDGAEQWHRRALARVASHIQNALHALQHPKECGKARLLLCELNKGCGFGCQFHHVVYCLLMAAATNRTMLLERDGAEWRYSRDGWAAVFRSVGSCTFAEHVPLSVVVDQFTGINQPNSPRIVRLPVVDGLSSRPPHLPLAFPAQFANVLLTHHSNPPVFFLGQFVAFLMRKNERTNKFVEEAMRRIPFELGPVVGLQIRRTDKVGTEAAFHHFSFLGLPLKKRIFIATDDKTVIEEARTEWAKKGFEIWANDESAEAALPSNRYSDRSLLGVIADVHILAHCSYIVCTFSSQVCRLSYELMQALHGDAAERVHSLDDIFYFGGQLAHEWEAIGEFSPKTDEQIELKPGDVIGVAGNHWNGFSKGTNRRTRRSGLFPSYLAREKWRIVDFAIFDQRQNKNKTIN